MSPRFGPALAVAFASAVAYGASGPFATLASRLGMPGADMVLWRALVMLAASAAVVAMARLPLAVGRPSRVPLGVLALVTAVTSTCYLSSVAFVPVAVAAVVFYTFPILILIASPLVDRVPITGTRVGIFAVAFLGVLLVVGPGFGGFDPRGLVLAGVASLGAAGMMFAANRAMQGTSPLAASVWIHVLMLPILAAFVLFTGGPVAVPTSPQFGVVFAVIALTYVAGLLMQLWAMRHLPAVVAGLVYLAEPVVAILLAAWLLDERLTGLQYLGCAVVFVALVAASFTERRDISARQETA